jgi:hypothetical protein
MLPLTHLNQATISSISPKGPFDFKQNKNIVAYVSFIHTISFAVQAVSHLNLQPSFIPKKR